MFCKRREKKTLTREIYDFCRQMVIQDLQLINMHYCEKKDAKPNMGLGTQVIKTWYW
jgi:hypothetical protein